jgi:hypothetical protein
MTFSFSKHLSCTQVEARLAMCDDKVKHALVSKLSALQYSRLVQKTNHMVQ